MIHGIDQFVPLSATESGVPRLDRREALARLIQARSGSAVEDSLGGVLQRSFTIALLDALRRAETTSARRPGSAPAQPAPAPLPPLASAFGGTASSAVIPTPASDQAAPDVGPATSDPRDEDAQIREAAGRAGIDARFLHALRRAENGGPGREFGVLSVPAPTYDEQARVAAESIRRSTERFERTGRQAIDPVTGRYTEAFIRFFSKRWAPVGAANDPKGLNQYHAGNLLRLYAQFSSREG